MAFKGEIAVGILNSKLKTGFEEYDIYRVQGGGNLLPNNLAVEPGEFVEWYNGAWRKTSQRYLITEEVEEAAAPVAGELLKKPGSTGRSIDYKAGYVVGNYYQLDSGTTIWQCTAIDDEGDDPRQIHFQKVSGLLSIINGLVERIVTLENS